ncbi:MAG: hypothetical protein WC860_07615 [Candidatus Margulisiibacteriota bacterium]|jgi:hypothetical protein
MKLKNILSLGFFCITICSSALFATSVSPRYLDLSLTITPVTTFNLVSDSSVSIGQVVPNYDYQSKPFSVANDPWQIAAPVKVQVYVENNTKANIYIYTDHQRQGDYWALSLERAVQIRDSTDISGLVNVESLYSYEPYLATVPMIAWVDWDETGSVTHDPNANWVYILDTMGSPLFSVSKQPLPLLADWQTTLKRNLDIYILTCWNKPKFSGTYQARIFMTLDQQ